MKQYILILKRLLIGLGVLLISLLLLAGGIYLWYHNRPQPDPVAERPLFEGITYTREVWQEPRPLVIHVARIDLTAPGIAFLVTPRDSQYPSGFIYEARTVSEFLDDYDLQLAINGDFFFPGYDKGPWDYYPERGDGVNPRGYTLSAGALISGGLVRSHQPPTIFITAENEVSFITPPQSGEPYNAISGNEMLILAGQAQTWQPNSYTTGLHPRTAIGLDASGQTLILVVVDGRQPNYSEGVTLPEMADLMLAYGASIALNLDGGGSSAMVIMDENGDPEVLNSPIHSRVPGWERPTANQFGVYAAPLNQ